jgi:hypothetical protein
MRAMAMTAMTLTIGLLACGNAEEEGRRAAQAKAAAETKQEVATQAAVKVNPPVPGRAHIPCTQLIDAAQFTEALAEVEPIKVTDITQTDADAAAVCALIRGGVRPDPKQQAEMIKKAKGGRLGAIPGDELCRVSAFCWTIEDDVKYRAKCPTDGDTPDESTAGGWSCMHLNAQGSDDVYSYRFVDEDTKCILKINGGPSMVDNEFIATCAKTARTLIGKPQITPGMAPAPAPTGSGSGSATGAM